MNYYDICIIGGGASGSVCAIQLAKKGYSVCVLDKEDFPAKKLLVTGNGRCNITNINMSSEYYNINIDKYLQKFNQNDCLNFFREIGLETYADSEGRCYPISNTAKSVVEVIKNQFQKLNIKFLANQTVTKVSLNNNEYLISSQEQVISCKKVIFATGLNKDIINILDDLHIFHFKPIKNLVALKTAENTKRLAGIRLNNVKVVAKCGNKTMEQFGEVLFKEDGLSGICIFNLSTLFARNNNFSGQISINLLPNLTLQEITEKIKHKINVFDNAGNLLSGMFHKEICTEILKRSHINQDALSKSLTDKNIKEISNVITNFNFTVVDCYDNNQIFSGGIDIDRLTMGLESVIYKNMYFCGEICNVDAICGGYNLQWAWTSANIIVDNIK